MTPNTGKQPPSTRGKRITGTLRNGMSFGTEQITPTSPLGWGADSARWTLTGSPFDIAEWRVVK